MKSKLRLNNIRKVYQDGDTLVEVLKDVSLDVKAGELIAVVGPSGSGKSTFLSIAGALLSPTEGQILLDGIDITKASPTQMNHIRLNKIGFVFQNAHLIPYLTVQDQLLLLAELSGQRGREASKRAEKLLARLGLTHRAHNHPDTLSGGEKQRVAIARAWMNDPEILLADEPTASLDSERGRSVVKMLADEVKLREKAAIMVTHDERMLDLCDRVVFMEDGSLRSK
ncbi:ABC transporter ATP-binding protein [Priestia koreensis]|uniref:Putative hemin import ATP-binding protein HrtA n=1 Tax=Priestia koreensis TaxID=284581 RepID=A0A0M0L4I2_9BACI|nr:ABC transporter ATP-binding protein [Priestia koreensis]KOO45970.1 hemin ABC transporter ATP-binding protein [Priestia koreensis]MCM3006516.1 ABC transporter ATP-binding protein [Priestia koreensis]